MEAGVCGVVGVVVFLFWEHPSYHTSIIVQEKNATAATADEAELVRRIDRPRCRSIFCHVRSGWWWHVVFGGAAIRWFRRGCPDGGASERGETVSCKRPRSEGEGGWWLGR